MSIAPSPEISSSPIEIPVRKKAEVFSIQIDSVTVQEAVNHVIWKTEQPFEQLNYVVTPNLDHVVQLQSNSHLREAYRDAWMVLADGWPIVWSARRLGKSLPERVAGSDLIPKILENGCRLDQPLTVFLLGGEPGVPETAAQNITDRWTWVDVVGCSSPAWGFEASPKANAEIIAQINDAEPDVLIVGLGAPKQELWLHQHRNQIRAKVAIAGGATIDFLAGRQQRAPKFFQRYGLEWLHRLACNPRRLAGRYVKDALVFPWLFTNELSRKAHFE